MIPLATRRTFAHRHIGTIKSQEELRAYADALPVSQPDVAADEGVQTAIRERRVALYRGEGG